nr:MAG TPA: Dynein heavy chain, N-terminal region 2 [Caudoviricetes sp.]
MIISYVLKSKLRYRVGSPQLNKKRIAIPRFFFVSIRL